MLGRLNLKSSRTFLLQLTAVLLRPYRHVSGHKPCQDGIDMAEGSAYSLLGKVRPEPSPVIAIIDGNGSP